MTLYVKAISRKEAEGREKMLPVEFLGQTLVAHGQDFQADSEFGNCLIGWYNGTLHMHAFSQPHRYGPCKRVDCSQTGELRFQRNLVLAGISRTIPGANEGVPGNIDCN